MTAQVRPGMARGKWRANGRNLDNSGIVGKGMDLGQLVRSQLQTFLIL